jgi:hypothetical protein
VPKQLIVIGNLLVAVLLSVAGDRHHRGVALRGADFTISTGGLAWFIAAAWLRDGCTGSPRSRQPPADARGVHRRASRCRDALLFAGGLRFPALPAALTVVAKVLPITHVLALMRYGM